MTIGERIREYRTEKGITLEELADSVGVCKQTVWKYENDVIPNIPFDRIERIASFLGVEPSDIVGWKTIPTVDVGHRIREFREANGLTLSDLETATGIPAQTLNRYELGQRSPKCDVVTCIADSVGIDPMWLLGYQDNREGTEIKNLITFRKSMGLKQSEFADSIGYKRSTYAAYEKGAREPATAFWVAISKKYGVSIDYLMGVTDIPFHPKQTSLSVKDALHAPAAPFMLTPENCEKLADYLALLLQSQK